MRRSASGNCLCCAHRVGQPRHPDDPGVGRDDQDRRREDRDVVPEAALDRRREADVLDEAGDRVVREPAGQIRRRVTDLQILVRAVERLRVAHLRRRRAVHRQRRQRDRRQERVDREHGDDHVHDRARDVPGRVDRLLGHVRDRLDAGVGHHRDRDRDDEVAPCRRRPRGGRCDWSVSGEKTTNRPITTSSAWVARSASARKMLSPAASFTPTMLSAARSTHDEGAADDVHRMRAKRVAAGEDRQVVRHEDRRDRDRHRVVQHLRPTGEERDAPR